MEFNYPKIVKTVGNKLMPLEDKDYNKKPNARMTLARLQEMGAYSLYYRVPPEYVYTIGIDSNLLVWGGKTDGRCNLVESYSVQGDNFESAYSFFCKNCEAMLRRVKLVIEDTR